MPIIALPSVRSFLPLIFAAALLPATASAASRVAPPRHFPIGASAPSAAQIHTPADMAARIGSWKIIEVPLRTQGLSPRELHMIEKLAEASQEIDGIYARQSDSYAATLVAQLKSLHGAREAQILRYLYLNGGQYELLNGLQSFVTPASAPLGREFFPPALSREALATYLAAHPEEKAELLSPTSLVREMGAGLAALPYRAAYRVPLAEAARTLREAATLSDDADFAAYLRATSEALTSDNFSESRRLHAALKDSKFDFVIGPQQSALDRLTGVKQAYGAALMLRNAEESRKLEPLRQALPELEREWPLIAAAPQPTQEIEIVDAPLRAGELLHGEPKVALRMPLEEGKPGVRVLLLREQYESRFEQVTEPLAGKVMVSEQAGLPSAAASRELMVWQELARSFTPLSGTAQSAVADPESADLEAARAEALALCAAHWRIEHGSTLGARELDATWFAELLRASRFAGSGPEGRGAVMLFHALLEQGVITPRAGTRSEGTARIIFAFDEQKLAKAVDSLARELLALEGRHDADASAKWAARYAPVPRVLADSIGSLMGAPAALFPRFRPELLR